MNLASLSASLAAAAVATLAATSAQANPRPLPFTYPYETLPKGGAEVEQYVDATWVHTPKDSTPGAGNTFAPRYRLQSALEYGITDRLELATYLVWAQGASASPTMTFEGTKLRLRYRIGDEGDLPVDVALYGEVAAFHDEYELEEKLILSKRLGALKLTANLWVKQAFERGEDEMKFIVNPTIGAAYELAPELFVGVEYWARGVLGSDAAAGTVGRFNDDLHHFVGPAVSLNLGRVWWSLAIYARVDDLSRTSQVGDSFGKVWARSLVGINL